jgi:type II secretion system protein H
VRIELSAPGKHRGGFTLLELVLVMVIMCTALALVAPSLRGWSHGAELRDAADQFVAITRLARSQAAANSSTYRMVIDSQAGTYKLMQQNGQDFIELGTSWGRAYQLPEGVHIELAKNLAGAPTGNTFANNAAPAPPNTIDFYATGRTEQVQVRMSSDHGGQFVITCPSPAEGFVINSTEGS